MLYSVVIPTRHRDPDLARALERLQPGQQTGIGAADYEVIVTDDGTSSRAEQMLRERFPWARWTEGPHRGPAANRNHGAAQARGVWLAFTDDDCVPDSRWLHAITCARADGARIVEGAVHPIGDPTADKMECPVNVDGGRFWSANISVERALFLAVGGFDEGFLTAAYEDQDLFLRLAEQAPVRWSPDCIVRHPVRPFTLKKRLQGLPLRMQMHARFLAKHRPSELQLSLAARYCNAWRKQKSRLRQSLLPLKPTKLAWCLVESFWTPWVSHRCAKVHQPRPSQT